MAHTVFETDGPVATLTFNRPEARNAMTWEMYQALVEACERVDRDAAVRVLVFRGAGGKAFVAGTDIAQFQEFKNREDGLKYEERLDHVLERLERVTKPTIAQVEGVAAGGGCAIALTCDLRVATPEAAFGIPIARTLGNCLSMANTARLVDLIGPARTRELVFRARLVGGDEALQAGLVNEVVADEQLLARALEVAEKLASGASAAFGATKRLIAHSLGALESQMVLESETIARHAVGEEGKEGVSAFLDKRTPHFPRRD